MAMEFDLVTLDAPDPRRLADFWAAVLDLVVTEDEDDGRWIVLSSHEGERRLGIQRGESRPGTVHLDLRCERGAFDAAVERAVDLGATLLAPPRHEPYGAIANLADPDGNPFDVCAYV